MGRVTMAVLEELKKGLSPEVLLGEGMLEKVLLFVSCLDPESPWIHQLVLDSGG